MHVKAEAGACLAGQGHTNQQVPGQWLSHIRLGCNTQGKVREPDMGQILPGTCVLSSVGIQHTPVCMTAEDSDESSQVGPQNSPILVGFGAGRQLPTYTKARTVGRPSQASLQCPLACIRSMVESRPGRTYRISLQDCSFHWRTWKLEVEMGQARKGCNTQHVCGLSVGAGQAGPGHSTTNTCNCKDRVWAIPGWATLQHLPVRAGSGSKHPLF